MATDQPRTNRPPSHGSAKNRADGMAEPGWDRFKKFRERSGSSELALRGYADVLGTVRHRSPKPLLELTPDEVADLDVALLKLSPRYRVVLRMFYRANGRGDILDSMPRQRRVQKRRIGMDDILTPTDVAALILHATTFRDCAVIAVIAATGCRVTEAVNARLKDVRRYADHHILWFGHTKVASQERYSLPIEGFYKDTLDKWLSVHPSKSDPNAWLFPSSTQHGLHLTEGRAWKLTMGCAKRAGIRKRVNPHSFRHARVTWGVIRKEDSATLCIGIWGTPFSAQLNRYSHFRGLPTTDADTPEHVTLPDVPPMPVPPALGDHERVSRLESEIAKLRELAEFAIGLGRPKQPEPESND